MLTVCAVGASHRTAPLAVRERLAIPARAVPEALATLRRGFALEEVAILSTCNRVELYAVGRDSPSTVEALTDFLSLTSRLEPDGLQDMLYRLEGRQAVAHLFRVAAGLDSMILGESEIAAQVKEAYRLASEQGATGPALNLLFQKALHAAKAVRSRTEITRTPVSIGSVITALARERLGERFSTSEVLLWGAGKAAETTARHLVKSGIGQLWIVSRSPSKAQELALDCNGGWLSWEQALACLTHVDLAIVCTQAPHYVLDANDTAAILPQRCGRPLHLIDLAVPRNIDPLLKRLPGIQLHDIEDIQAFVQQGLVARTQEADRCTALVEHHVGDFERRRAYVNVKEVIR